MCLECHANLPANELGAHGRRGPARVPRSELAGLPELHRLPSEDSRQPYRQELTQMRGLLILLAAAPLAWRKPCPQVKRRRPVGNGAQAAAQQTRPQRTDDRLHRRRRLPRNRPRPPRAPRPRPCPPAKPTSPAGSTSAIAGVSDVGGNFDTYRSWSISVRGPSCWARNSASPIPKHRLFDQIHVRAYDWGDDPYSTLHHRCAQSEALRFQRRLPRHCVL